MAGYTTGGWLIALLAAAASEPRPPPPAQAPSMELLLHLAEFGDADGRYVDPTEVDIAVRKDAPQTDPKVPRTRVQGEPDAEHDENNDENG